jgi:hypothetical protein
MAAAQGVISQLVLTVGTQLAPFGSHSRRIDASGARTLIGG